MAKATVRCTCKTCGKVFTARADKANRREADSWEQWASKNITECPECRKAAYSAKQQAIVNAKVAGCPVAFPELIGSEKQVNWANDIREHFIAKLTDHKFPWQMVVDKSYPAANKNAIEAELAKMMTISAKAWIEMRGKKIFEEEVE